MTWQTVESDIYLLFGNEDEHEEHNSISAFPRCWDERRVIPMASRLHLSEARRRQPSRRGRPEWCEPTSELVPMLGRYAQERNPGLATDEEMSAVQERLNTPLPLQMPPAELAVGAVTTDCRWELDRKYLLYEADHEPYSPYESSIPFDSNYQGQSLNKPSISTNPTPPSYSLRSPYGYHDLESAELDSSPVDTNTINDLNETGLFPQPLFVSRLNRNRQPLVELDSNQTSVR